MSPEPVKGSRQSPLGCVRESLQNADEGRIHFQSERAKESEKERAREREQEREGGREGYGDGVGGEG